MTNIIESNKPLSIVDGLNFAIIAIFVEGEQKKEIMEKLAYLFSKGKIESQLQLDLHHVLTKMLKKHFEDNRNKCKEMLRVISESIFATNYSGLTYEERTKRRMEELARRQARKDKHYKENMELKDKQLKQKDEQLTKKDEIIKNLKKQLANQKK